MTAKAVSCNATCPWPLMRAALCGDDTRCVLLHGHGGSHGIPPGYWYDAPSSFCHECERDTAVEHHAVECKQRDTK